jgi:hypothetical protein
MARGYFRRGKSRKDDEVHGIPRGPLYWVLKEYHESLPAPSRGSSFVESARTGSGFYVRVGVGCDAVMVDKERPDPRSPTLPGSPRTVPKRVVSKCRGTTCHCSWYRLRDGGVTLGVRACSDHSLLLVDEELWERNPARSEDFAVYEVMSE